MTRNVEPLTAEEIEHVFAALEAGDPPSGRARSVSERFGEDPPTFDDGGYGDDDVEPEIDDGEGDDEAATAFDQEVELPPAPGLLERLLGVTALVSLTAFGMMLQGAHPDELLSIPPMLVVVAVVLGGLIASHGPRMVYSLIGICLGMQALDDAEARGLHDMCSHGRRLAYVGGIVQLVTSAMFVFSVLDTPSLYGSAIGGALTGLVFAVLLAEVGFGSVRHWIRTCLY